MPSPLRLVVEDLSQRYDDLDVFAGLSFTVAAGEALVVTGTNGSGKSTLLRTLAGLMPAASGTVRLEGGKPDAAIEEQCHLVGALNAIKPELTVRENLAQWNAVLDQRDDKIVSETLRVFDLDRFADMPALVLSTGWRRRLGLARIMVAPRPLWLLDEPTAALDLAASRRVSDLVRAHLKGGGLAVIATHLDLGLDGARTLELAAPTS